MGARAGAHASTEAWAAGREGGLQPLFSTLARREGKKTGWERERKPMNQRKRGRLAGKGGCNTSVGHWPDRC